MSKESYCTLAPLTATHMLLTLINWAYSVRKKDYCACHTSGVKPQRLIITWATVVGDRSHTGRYATRGCWKSHRTPDWPDTTRTEKSLTRGLWSHMHPCPPKSVIAVTNFLHMLSVLTHPQAQSLGVARTVVLPRGANSFSRQLSVTDITLP